MILRQLIFLPLLSAVVQFFCILPCVAPSALAQELLVGTQASGSGTIGIYGLDGSAINPSLITGFHSVPRFVVADGYIFVDQQSFVSKYTLSGQLVNAALITGLQNSLQLTAADGYLYVTDYAAGTVGKYTLDGQTINAALITGLTNPTGITEAGGHLFVTSGVTGSVAEFTTNGVPENLSYISGLTQPFSLTAADGYLYITHILDPTPGNIFTSYVSRYQIGATPIGGKWLTLLAAPEQVAVFNDKYYVADWTGLSAGGGPGEIVQFDFPGPPSHVTSLSGGPVAIAVIPEPTTVSLLCLTSGLGWLATRGRWRARNCLL